MPGATLTPSSGAVIVDFTSMPREFFAVVPNAEMMGVFWMREEKTLYGRRTEVMLDGRAIGDIVEILPLA